MFCNVMVLYSYIIHCHIAHIARRLSASLYILRVIYYIEGGLGSALGHVMGIHAELYNNLLQ